MMLLLLRRAGVLALAGLAVLVGGCLSAQETYVQQHPELAPPVREAIQHGSVVAGMTPEQVRASWGSPDHETRTRLPGGREEMVWSWGQLLITRDPQGRVVSENTRIITRRNVVFLDGVVTSYSRAR